MLVYAEYRRLRYYEPMIHGTPQYHGTIDKDCGCDWSVALRERRYSFDPKGKVAVGDLLVECLNCHNTYDVPACWFLPDRRLSMYLRVPWDKP